jgi:hypothetical protein
MKDKDAEQLRNLVGRYGFTSVIHELASIADDFYSQLAAELRHARNRLIKFDQKLAKGRR